MAQGIRSIEFTEKELDTIITSVYDKALNVEDATDAQEFGHSCVSVAEKINKAVGGYDGELKQMQGFVADHDDEEDEE